MASRVDHPSTLPVPQGIERDTGDKVSVQCPLRPPIPALELTVSLARLFGLLTGISRHAPHHSSFILLPILLLSYVLINAVAALVSLPVMMRCVDCLRPDCGRFALLTADDLGSCESGRVLVVSF